MTGFDAGKEERTATRARRTRGPGAASDCATQRAQEPNQAVLRPIARDATAHQRVGRTGSRHPIDAISESQQARAGAAFGGRQGGVKSNCDLGGYADGDPDPALLRAWNPRLAPQPPPYAALHPAQESCVRNCARRARGLQSEWARIAQCETQGECAGRLARSMW
jgi:hypothetical protein